MGFFDELQGYDSTSNVNGKGHNDFNKKILLASVVFLSIVLVLVFALHLYARFVLRRQARRRAAIHHLTLTVAHANAQTNEPHNTGLDPLVIKALPMFIFKRKREDHDYDECAVCLSVLENEETVRLLPNCKHTFHIDCIDTWLASHSTCPICRTKAEPRLEPQPREGPNGSVLHGAPTAPFLVEPIEGTSDGITICGSPKVSGSNSRFSSFRRILSRERSSRRIQPSGHDEIGHDLERQ
ncbi:unnamed protein product [Lupinus luteus]|uniref:RING-type E3 ubiquitin transferase n=1 Tax=Lupinus luteus TaxID=3873 RepID=A0AAV1XM05_LUPLU